MEKRRLMLIEYRDQNHVNRLKTCLDMCCMPHVVIKEYEFVGGGALWKIYGGEITRAMNARNNAQVQAALCKYILEQDYNPDICDYIRSVDWLGGLEKLNSICWRCKRLGRAVDGCPGTTEQVWTGCVYREV